MNACVDSGRCAGSKWLYWLAAAFAFGALAVPFIWFFAEDFSYRLVRILIVVFLGLLVARVIRFRADPALWLGLASIFTLLLGYVWQLNSVPEDMFGGSLARRYWVIFFFPVMVAYATLLWKPFSPHRLLIVAALGGVLYLGFEVPAQEWVGAWRGYRMDYEFWNAQHAGVFFGSGLLAIIFLAPRAITTARPSLRLPCALLVAGFVCLMLWGVITTQVRAVWLGLIFGALVAAALFFVIAVRARLSVGRASLLTGAAVLTLLAAIFVGADVGERIEKRLAAESISVEALAEAATFEKRALSSSEVRVASWAAAVGWVGERPFLGWGRHTVKQLIMNDERFGKRFKQLFGHLHNSYLEGLVAVGVLGVLPWLLLACWIGRCAVASWRAGVMPTEAFLLSWAFFAFWVVVNFFESYINSSTGFWILAVFGGWVYAFHLGRGRQSLQA